MRRPKGNQVSERDQRSSGLLFNQDAGDVFAFSDGTAVVPTMNDEDKNSYADIAAAAFDEFSREQDPRDFLDKQNSAGEEIGGLLTNGNSEMVGHTPGGSQRHALAKRFNEFVGKRSSVSEDLIHENAEKSEQGVERSPENIIRILDRVSGVATRENNEGVEEGYDPLVAPKENLMRRVYAFLQNGGTDKRQYEFVGKRPYDFLGKRGPYDFIGKRYEFVGKRMPYEFLGKRMPYEFLGKRSPYEFIGKRSYDFVGKRAPYEFIGKRDQSDESLPTINSGELGPKRYAEFLGKRKRMEEEGEAALTDSERLAALLQNNGLRKRLSRMLLTHRLAEQYPEFIGK